MRKLLIILLCSALAAPGSAEAQEGRGGEGDLESNAQLQREGWAAQAHQYRVEAKFARARGRLWQWLKTHLPASGGIPEGFYDDSTAEANEIAERYEAAAESAQQKAINKPTDKPSEDGIVRLPPMHVRLQCGAGTGECMYCWCYAYGGTGPPLYPLGWRRASACIGVPC